MRPVVEDTLQIDLAEPAVRRTFARIGSGELSWWVGDTRLASIGYIWTGAVLVLRYRVGACARREVIATETTQPRFGGARRWFRCPTTGKRVRAIILPDGAARWASVEAHAALYRSQLDASGVLHDIVRACRRSEARGRRNAIRRLRRRERCAH